MVNRLSLLINSNIIKSKKRIIIVCLLCVLATLLMNIVFILTFNYSKNFYKYKESLNGPDITYHYIDLSKTATKEDLASIINNEDGVIDVEVVESLYNYGESEFGDGSILKLFSFYSERNYKEKKLDQFEILDCDESISSGIYLGYIYKAAQNYNIGDKIKIIIANVEYEFVIKGFYNNVSTGTVNCVDVAYILTDDIYNELLLKVDSSFRISVICKDGVDINDVTRRISNTILEKYPNLYLNHTQTIKDTYNSRYSNAKLFQTILLVSSILIIAILLIMIAIVLSNYVRSNISNLGMLKALGYTSNSLILPIIIEFGVILAFSSIFGIGLSYAIFPLINKALEAQIGIPYIMRFIFEYAIFTILIILALGVLTVYLSVYKITYIEPLNAIKTKKSSQSVNNIASLDRTNLKLNTAIGLKTCLSRPSRNIVIAVCYLMVSFLIGFSCFLYSNVIKKPDEVIELVCGQVPNVSLSVSEDYRDSVLIDLENDSEVNNYYLYTIKKVLPKTGKIISFFVTEDNKDINIERVLINGRLAENGNEIAINKCYALDNNLKIGDELIFDVAGNEISYEIVGFTQGGYYNGTDGYMLLDGYNRIDELSSFTYYVDLKEGCDTDIWIKSFKKNSNISSITNEYKYFNSTAMMYKKLLIILCIVIIALSLLISCFVLYILISILLENKRREFGIFKSLGFVTKELIYQVILSIIPFVFVSTLIGTILAKKLTDPILSSLLNSIGIFNFGKEISLSSTILCIVSISFFTIIYTLFSSLSIRRITPHELFNKE